MKPSTTLFARHERNYANAQASTGPRTAAGKAVSRRNALNHGLCANPAARTIEDGRAFEQLHQSLTERFHPRDAMEAGLIHRMATALWRLQRAARVDAAAADLSVHAVASQDDRVRHWLDRINREFSAVDCVAITDEAVIQKRRDAGELPRPTGQFYRLERSFLRQADDLRDQTMMQDDAALTAMLLLIDDLMTRLTQLTFNEYHAQLLAWLLGESLDRLLPADHEPDHCACFYPDEKPWATAIDLLIGEARKRAMPDEPLPQLLTLAVESRCTTLRSLRNHLAGHVTQQDCQTVALLPDAATFDRLMRYESHAERSLKRCLDMLASLRGVTIESIAATITAPASAGGTGSTLQFRGERTLWTPTA